MIEVIEDVRNEFKVKLTDLARTKINEAPADVVKNWLRNKETIFFLEFGKN